MRVRIISIVFATVFALPVLANGPMNDPGMSNNNNSNTNSSNTGQMSPGREKWTRNRITILKGRRKRAAAEKHPYDEADMYSRLQQQNDPFAVTISDKRREAIRRQHEIDTIELLALKKERGEITPAQQKKLNALIRHVRTEGH